MPMRPVYCETGALGYAWTIVKPADRTAWADRLADLPVRACARLRAAHPEAFEAKPQGFSL